MSGRPGRKSRDLDPLVWLGNGQVALPSSAACEVVKAARASLKEPARPVTPADCDRRLLSGAYANRPSTAGRQLCSNDFLSSFGDWPLGGAFSQQVGSCQQSLSPDVWKPPDATSPAACPGSPFAGSSSGSNTRRASSNLPELPTGRQSRLSSGAGLRLHPLLPAGLTATSHSSSSSSGDATPALLGSSAACAADSNTSLQASGSSRLLSWRQPTHASHQSTSSSDSSSRGSSSGSSRGSSSDAAAPVVASAVDQPCSSATSGGETMGWQVDVLRVLSHMQLQPVSPGPAQARQLLEHVVDLQCLIDTAEDQQHLRESLTAPMSARAGTGTAANLQQLVVAALIRLIDCPQPDVLTKVGAVLLRVLLLSSPSSTMMQQLARMLYKLSKDSSNDTRFRHHGVFRPLLMVLVACSSAMAAQEGQALAGSSGQQQQQQQVLLYLVGALKNTSNDAANQACLGRLNAVAGVAQVLLVECQVLQRSQHCCPERERAVQVCVQATAVLRNLAVAAGNAALFQQQEGKPLTALLKLLASARPDEPELLLNVARCLSKLSMSEGCRRRLLQPTSADVAACSPHDCVAAARPGSSAGRPRSGVRGVRALPQASRQVVGQGSVDVGHTDETIQAASSTQQQQQQQQQKAQDPPFAVTLLLEQLLPALAASVSGSGAMLLRVAFVLGNLTCHHPEARAAVAATPGAVERLVQQMLELHELLLAVEQPRNTTLAQQHLLQHLHADAQQPRLQRQASGLASQQQLGPQQGAAAPLAAGAKATDAGLLEDLLVRLLRLAANAAIDPDAGLALASQPSTATLLVQLLQCHVACQQREQLVLNAVAMLSNVAFFLPAAAAAGSSMFAQLQDPGGSLLPPLLTLLTSSNDEAVEEAARAVGNLVRGSSAGLLGELLPTTVKLPGDASNSSAGGSNRCGGYVLEALVVLLGHASWQVVGAVAGAILNMTAAASSQGTAAVAEVAATLVQAGFAAEVCEVLERLLLELPTLDTPAGAEVGAARLVLQCLSNMVHCGGSGCWWSHQEAQDIQHLLSEVQEAAAACEAAAAAVGTCTGLIAEVLAGLSTLS